MSEGPPVQFAHELFTQVTKLFCEWQLRLFSPRDACCSRLLPGHGPANTFDHASGISNMDYCNSLPVSKLHDRQAATTDPECSSATCFGNLQVRLGYVISAAQRSALARRYRAHQLQTVYRYLQEKDPRYLVDCCTPVTEVTGRR